MASSDHPGPTGLVRAGNAAPVGAEVVRFWRARVARFATDGRTPAFVFAAEPLAQQVALLAGTFGRLAVRHWWSFKTLPLRAAADWWRRAGHPVEVVSEYEWRAVRALGFPVDRILVNGPAKHTWLAGCGEVGMRVNFDSLEEIRRLGGLAKRLRWKVGVRLMAESEVNTEYPGVRSQFGLSAGETGEAARLLARARLEVGVVHCHLRTNVPEAGWYARAAGEVLGRARSAGWRPGVLDLGGGFPVARVATRKGAPVDAGFSLGAMRDLVAGILRREGVAEVWMENGRWLTAPAGVLAVRVVDEKRDRGVRTLIADGGRTLQAMVATWERHGVVPLRPRRGGTEPTLLCGPTCMAFDNLGIHDLPRTVGVGDVLIWLDAGAYQTSWETRFSHGLAAVGWCEGDRWEVVRGTETYAEWVRSR